MKKLGSTVAAFSLVEVTLALGVAAFCLIAVFGLMPVGVQTNRNATSQTAATNIIAAVVADLRATPKTTNTSTQFSITFGTNRTLYFDGAGQFSTTSGPNSRYQLNVTWNSAPSGLRYADFNVTWPASASPSNASGSVEMFAAFDRN
ncbi:MAG TPA: Verru_Chthon cassette protein B [Candidatus Udaeobacter sp.]|nr:Verru_Chthon cassette protein B [Candidatus Udaeobacter sp.]